MNLLIRILPATLALVACTSQDLGTPPAAEYATKPGRVAIVEAVARQAERHAAAGESGAALKTLDLIIAGELGTEAEAQAQLAKAQLLVDRQQYDPAVDILDDLYLRHSAFAGFTSVVELQFRIANELAEGRRRLLAGWFPWFRDRPHALVLYEKTLALAPNGPLADESLIRAARLALELAIEGRAAGILERLISDYPASKHLPEALERLADLRAKESLGADWDQAAALEAADHWRTLADQFPRDPHAAKAGAEIARLRDQAARARLNLATLYWARFNNPEAAKLMANACRTIAPESPAAKEAEALLAMIQKNPNPPITLADRVLGKRPRPRLDNGTAPTAVGGDLDTLGFKKEAVKSATETERR
jgi:outer membrane protein assembly factor BamD (BamD/ComL family)